MNNYVIDHACLHQFRRHFRFWLIFAPKVLTLIQKYMFSVFVECPVGWAQNACVALFPNMEVEDIHPHWTTGSAGEQSSLQSSMGISEAEDKIFARIMHLQIN